MFYWALGGAQVARFHGNTVILHLYSNCAMDLDRGPPLRPRVGLRTSPDWDTPPRRRQRGRLRVFLSAGGRMRRRRIVHLGLWRPARLCLWWSSTMLRARRGLPGRAVRGRLRQCRPVQWHLLRRIPDLSRWVVRGALRAGFSPMRYRGRALLCPRRSLHPERVRPCLEDVQLQRRLRPRRAMRAEPRRLHFTG